MPQKQRKKRRLGHSDNSCVRRKAEHKDHVWTWDFIHDRTTNGRPLKWLSIVDEYTRECVALEVDRSITAEKVIDVLVELFRIRGVPKHIRSDNGPEFIAQAIRRWLSQAGVETLYVEPGSPWENGYAESFHSRLRDELTNREEFTNLAEAKHLADAWRLEYNHRRPHSSLGYQTPAEFAAGCAAASAPAAPPLQQQHSRNPEVTITRYPTNTLITPGTENGGRPVMLRACLAARCFGSWIICTPWTTSDGLCLVSLPESSCQPVGQKAKTNRPRSLDRTTHGRKSRKRCPSLSTPVHPLER